MGIEIERKFLLLSDAWRAEVACSELICQGYLNADPARTVRVRIKGDTGYLTVKGPNQGIARAEFDYVIPVAEARMMLDTLCLRPLLEKTRHLVRRAGLLWEIDEFAGDNAGLVVAEVELADAGQGFTRPDWLGAEVSDDPRYYNSNLLHFPWRRWPGA